MNFLVHLLGRRVKVCSFFRKYCQFSTEGEQSYTFNSRVPKSLTTLVLSLFLYFPLSDKWYRGLSLQFTDYQSEVVAF